MKNYQAWMILTLLVLCTSGAVSRSLPGDQPLSVSYCDLLSVPQKYDKEIVATKALIQSSYHEVHVYDSKCRSTVADDQSASIELLDGWNSTKLGKRLSKILRHDRKARVAFEAVFYGSGGPYGPERTRFRFVMRRLIAVEEVPKKETNPASSGVGKPNRERRVAQAFDLPLPTRISDEITVSAPDERVDLVGGWLTL